MGRLHVLVAAVSESGTRNGVTRSEQATAYQGNSGAVREVLRSCTVAWACLSVLSVVVWGLLSVLRDRLAYPGFVWIVAPAVLDPHHSIEENIIDSKDETGETRERSDPVSVPRMLISGLVSGLVTVGASYVLIIVAVRYLADLSLTWNVVGIAAALALGSAVWTAARRRARRRVPPQQEDAPLEREIRVR